MTETRESGMSLEAKWFEEKGPRYIERTHAQWEAGLRADLRGQEAMIQKFAQELEAAKTAQMEAGYMALALERERDTLTEALQRALARSAYYAEKVDKAREELDTLRMAGLAFLEALEPYAYRFPNSIWNDVYNHFRTALHSHKET
jgi:hypothetical protein